MAILTVGSLEDLIDSPGELAPDVDVQLPGLALTSLTILDTHELFGGKAEVYLFGVALDATGDVKIVPFGKSEIEKGTTALAVEKAEKGQTLTYLGQGLPLLQPPIKGFLFLRLLVIDDDQKIREIAPLLKAAGELVGSKEAILLLTAGGLPEAGAVAAVVGKATEGISIAVEKNRDDLIAVFQGYFTIRDTGTDVDARQEGAAAHLHWVT